MRKLTMSKKGWTITAIIAGTIAVVITLTACLMLIAPKGKKNHEYWNAGMEYKMANTVQLEKKADTDFKILQVTDLQLADAIEGKKAKHALDTLKKVVEDTKPDLIVSTGDQVWIGGRNSIKRIIKVMESFNVPWAPVMGNHDGEGNASFNWVADQFEKAENCVFKKGPSNIGGVGNYIINIKEADKIVQSLYMFDSGAQRYYPEQNAKKYEFIQPGQMAWYEWAVKGLERVTGENVASMAFLHIPVPEYKDAYDMWKASGFDPAIGFGETFEGVASAPVNNGLFDLMKALGSTKHMFAGHDHVNSYSIMYEGIRLTYGLKTGDTCYARPNQEMNGGTLITVTAGGAVKSIEHKYIKL